MTTRSFQVAAAMAALLTTYHAAVAVPIGHAVDRATDVLYEIDLATGAATPIGGGVGFADVRAVAFANSVLYGVDAESDKLISIDTTTGVGQEIGDLNLDINDLVGMSFESIPGRMTLSNWTEAPGINPVVYGVSFYSVDLGTGAASFLSEAVDGNNDPIHVARSAVFTDIASVNPLFGGGTFGSQGSLWNLNPTQGGAVGSTPNGGISNFDAGANFGLSANVDGVIWGVEAIDQAIFTLDAGAVQVASYPSNLILDNLAINKDATNAVLVVPEPVTSVLSLIGFTVLGASVRRR